MLIRLLPEQIANNWDFIKQNIVSDAPIERLGSGKEEVNNNILTCLLSGFMQAWIEAKSLEEPLPGQTEIPKHEIRALVITHFVEHPVTQEKGLQVYSLVGFNSSFRFEDWSSGLLTLVRFAHGNGCKYIQALTKDPGVLDFLARFKADVDYRFVCLPL